MLLGRRVASVACISCSHLSVTHPGDYNGARDGSGGTGPHLLQALELPGKCSARLVTTAQSGHESRVRERAGRELRIGETPTRGRRAQANLTRLADLRDQQQHLQ